MLVKVEQKHIDVGEKSDCWKCPVALAILALNPKPYDVSVKYSYVLIAWEKGQYHEYLLPQKVREFVIAFDNGCDVEPFEFELM